MADFFFIYGPIPGLSWYIFLQAIQERMMWNNSNLIIYLFINQSINLLINLYFYTYYIRPKTCLTIHHLSTAIPGNIAIRMKASHNIFSLSLLLHSHSAIFISSTSSQSKVFLSKSFWKECYHDCYFPPRLSAAAVARLLAFWGQNPKGCRTVNGNFRRHKRHLWIFFLEYRNTWKLHLMIWSSLE